MRCKTGVFLKNSLEFIENTPEASGVYLLTCPETNEKYVGVSKNLKSRIRRHLRSRNSKFIGFVPIVVEIVKKYDVNILNELEQKYISIFQPELNSPKASRYSG